jgi:hypothetical protein
MTPMQEHYRTCRTNGCIMCLELIAAEELSNLEISPEGEPTFTTTVAKFVRDNAEDEESVDVVARLAVGESVTLGGGAAPFFTVRRVA